jgi:hypothetical protein
MLVNGSTMSDGCTPCAAAPLGTSDVGAGRRATSAYQPPAMTSRASATVAATDTGRGRAGLHRNQTQRRAVPSSRAVGPHRPGDVLELLLAGEVEHEVELAVELVVSGAGHDHPARVAHLLQAGRHVHPVAVHVAVEQGYVAQVDPDPEHDPLGLRQADVAPGYGALDRDRAGDRVDHALEHDQGAVTHQLHEPAVVLGDQGVDDLGADCLEPGDGAGLVGLHQARVADHVGREDRERPTSELVHRHRGPPGCHSPAAVGEADTRRRKGRGRRRASPSTPTHDTPAAAS